MGRVVVDPIDQAREIANIADMPLDELVTTGDSALDRALREVLAAEEGESVKYAAFNSAVPE